MHSSLEDIHLFTSCHHTTKDNKHVKLIVQYLANVLLKAKISLQKNLNWHILHIMETLRKHFFFAITFESTICVQKRR